MSVIRPPCSLPLAGLRLPHGQPLSTAWES
jgi:hypothetical protein